MLIISLVLIHMLLIFTRTGILCPLGGFYDGGLCRRTSGCGCRGGGGEVFTDTDDVDTAAIIPQR